MQEFISKERLGIYESILKVKPSQVQAAYQWNKALSGALVPAMQCLEVTLRNAIDNGIRIHPPKGAKLKWLTDANWITSLPEYLGKKYLGNKRYQKVLNPKKNQNVDANNYLLDNNGNRLVVKKTFEEQKVEKTIKTIIKNGKIATPDRIISMMDFGFWTNLLDEKFEDNNAEIFLWPNLLSVIFPSAPKGTTRDDISNKFYRVRELRNRLSHHEAIWKFHHIKPGTNDFDYSCPVYGINANCSLLLKSYEEVLELIGWMSQDRLATFEKFNSGSRFKALCSVDGLNSFIAPEKIANQLTVSMGGKGVKKIINILNKNQFIGLTLKGKTIAIFGNDAINQFYSNE
ncbi:Abi family protein [Shewanella morhuae]|uniref:Abi-like protein n=1 Tax=Shewanella morhuae TaxID=365591 RepID=A0A380C0H7_9GAMM|nr:Abi family protein [Shewanella morhuae]SUJ09470.1 Abi-like protein [Shewanella morhuae]